MSTKTEPKKKQKKPQKSKKTFAEYSEIALRAVATRRKNDPTWGKTSKVKETIKKRHEENEKIRKTLEEWAKSGNVAQKHIAHELLGDKE